LALSAAAVTLPQVHEQIGRARILRVA